MQTKLHEPGLRPSHTVPSATGTAALVASSRGNVTPLTDVDSASRTVPPAGGVNDSIIRAYLDLETALVEGLADPAPGTTEAPLAAVDGPDLEPLLGEPVAEPDAADIPVEEAPDFAEVALEAPDLTIDTDLETALVEGLSDLAPEETESPLAAVDAPDLEPVLGEAIAEPDAAEMPEEEASDFAEVAPEAPDLAIAPDLETALVEGLSDLAPGTTEAPLAAVDGPDLEPLLGEPVAEPDVAEMPEEEASDFVEVALEAPDLAVDTDLETALVEGLSDLAPEATESPLAAVDAPDLEPALWEPVAEPDAADMPVEEVSDFAEVALEAPDLTIDTDLETALVEGLSDLAPEATELPLAAVDAPDLEPLLGEPVAEPDAADMPEEEAPDFVEVALEAPDLAIDTDLETALVEGLSDLAPGTTELPLAAVDGPDLEPVLWEPVAEPDAADMPVEEVPDFAEVALEAPDLTIDTDLETALVEGLSDLAPGATELPLAAVDAPDLEPLLGEPVVEPDAADMPVEEAPDFAEIAPEAPETPVSALAFAMDLETETVLREALFEYQPSSPDHEEPQVWPGGLRSGIDALAAGYSAPLLIVDIDGIPYPAGALYKLAAVCEIGTTVIAVGSDATAKASRQILLAGVSDYLTKPITAQLVSEAIAHATTAVTGPARFGRVAAFIGVGGSGATTLAVASALQVAKRGRYVSILDLNRTISQVSLMLDLEPAPGLDHLLDAADPSSPDPDIVDATRTHHSERVAVYAYRSGPSPPPLPEKLPVGWLLGQLRQRSHLVLIDGAEDPGLFLDLLEEVDIRVLVAEPTARDIHRASRLIDLLGQHPPVLLVQNHTRAFRRGTGMERQPDVVVPFESSLSSITDQGWPRNQVPRSLHKPLTVLADRLLSTVLDAPSRLQLAGGH